MICIALEKPFSWLWAKKRR